MYICYEICPRLTHPPKADAIFYTRDGSVPNENSSLYIGVIQLVSRGVQPIRATARKSGFLSDVASKTYYVASSLGGVAHGLDYLRDCAVGVGAAEGVWTIGGDGRSGPIYSLERYGGANDNAYLSRLCISLRQ